MIKIGIPRALLYYQYYPMWKTFFTELGAEVVISPPTTQAMLAEGSSRVVADTCLSVKIFLGHVLSLITECDFIFIPAVRSVKSKSYSCSKLLGLPDLTKAVIPESPPILDIDIDVNQSKHKLYLAIYKLGRFFTWNPLKIRQACLAAIQTNWDYQRLMYNDSLTPLQAIEKLSSTTNDDHKNNSSQIIPNKISIAVIGHSYLLYDEHTNYRLIHKLQQAHINVLTPEMVTPEDLESATAKLVGRSQWTCDHEVVGAGGYYLENKADGVIGIMTFGCGPDSLLMDTLQRQASKNKTTPFMSLTLEEHTAEAGVITRLEAFIDMIERRKRKQVAICA
ncbi:MAG: acyl-CoA dehydratase activase-related protein [Dehalococcoidales bacterium]|nr:acyl-CoA dehydratase activase-related protein [Dehalococcoidales bacterium]